MEREETLKEETFDEAVAALRDSLVKIMKMLFTIFL